MTRFIHDQFAKDYLEELLTPYGTIQSPRRVAGEVRQIDLWFSPKPEITTPPAALGILGRAIETAAIFEPFRNPVTVDEIRDCLLKLLEIHGELQREANRNRSDNIPAAIKPKLWILTPTASDNILTGCCYPRFKILANGDLFFTTTIANHNSSNSSITT